MVRKLKLHFTKEDMMKAQIRKQILEAMKAKNEAEKNILRVVLGDIELQESRTGKAMTDEQIQKVIKKTLEGVQELLKYKENDEKLLVEKQTLEAMLPKNLKCEEILQHLQEVKEQIESAKSDGQAIGVAMKVIREKKLPVDSRDVRNVVDAIRIELAEKGELE